MNNNELKIINFTTGIRSEDIEYNFNVIDNRINRERRNVGGPGIASGLDITINSDLDNFNIVLSEASIITNDGKELFMPETTVEIERPKLIREKEYLNSDIYNQLHLKYIPYANNRKFPAQFLNIYQEKDTGIKLKYQDSVNANDNIRITNIMKNVLSLTKLTRRDLEVTYNYTAKRIDTIYVDEDYKIKVLEGTTSTTPSAIMPTKFKYLIALIEIDPHYADKSGNTYAKISIKKDLRQLRNIHTDKDGKLWICGTPFDSLQIIHMTEPASPKLNTLWYDIYSNMLKIWRSTDEMVYMNKYTVTTDFDMYPNTPKDFQTDIIFKVGGEQLNVYHNDRKLTYGKEYLELNELGIPVDDADIQRGSYSNRFRITTNIKVGDTITYKVTSFDSHYMWVPINSSSYINVKESKMFGPGLPSNCDNYFMSTEALALGLNEDKYPYKYQYFFFNYDTEKHMMFTPGLRELDVNINQIPLYSDQFRELTIVDLYTNSLPESVAYAAREKFGYSYEITNSLNGEYENIGIGFMLIEPLDVGVEEEVGVTTDIYVEATVTRRVNDAPLKRKLQRSATFVAEKNVKFEIIERPDTETAYTFPIDEDGYYTVTIDDMYRYGENQLEVFINGIRLDKDKIIEGSDLSDEPMYAIPGDETSGIIAESERRRGAKTTQFKIKDMWLSNGDSVTYRITTNFYSYDHINQLIDEMNFDAKAASEKVDSIYEKTVDLQNNIDERITELDEQIQDIRDIANSLDNKYMEKEDLITEGQMPAWMVTNSIKSLDHNNTGVITYWADNESFDVSSHVKEQDFVMAIRRSNSNQMDRFLIRGFDYEIIDVVNDGHYERTLLRFTEEGKKAIETLDKVILTGIKISNLWR